MKLMLQENITYEDVDNAPGAVILNINRVLDAPPQEQVVILAEFFSEMGRVNSATVLRSLVIPFMQDGAVLQVEVDRDIRHRSYYFNIGINVSPGQRLAPTKQEVADLVDYDEATPLLPEPEPKPRRATMRKLSVR